MHEDIHFNMGRPESTVNIEKFVQEYFLSKSFGFKGGVIFPEPVWDGRMRLPSLLGKMKISLWPFVCFLRFILDFFLQKVKAARLFLE